MTILFIISLTLTIIGIIGAIGTYIWRLWHPEQKSGPVGKLKQELLGGNDSKDGAPIPNVQQVIGPPPNPINNDALLDDCWENGYMAIHNHNFLSLEEAAKNAAFEKVEEALNIMNTDHHNEADPRYVELQGRVTLLKAGTSLEPNVRQSRMLKEKFNSLMTEHQSRVEHSTRR